eukprot:PhF_6_TR15921/c3_g1_i1/m.24647
MIPNCADRVIKMDVTTQVMTGYATWPSGFTKGPNAFNGGVYDGTYVWMIPNATADRVIKVDGTSGSMVGFSQWPTGFTKDNSVSFSGGVFDGTSIWMIPFTATCVIRINIMTGAMSMFRRVGGVNNVMSYVSGVYDGTSIWMIPHNSGSLMKLYHGTMTSSKSLSHSVERPPSTTTMTQDKVFTPRATITRSPKGRNSLRKVRTPSQTLKFRFTGSVTPIVKRMIVKPPRTRTPSQLRTSIRSKTVLPTTARTRSQSWSDDNARNVKSVTAKGNPTFTLPLQKNKKTISYTSENTIHSIPFTKTPSLINSIEQFTKVASNTAGHRTISKTFQHHNRQGTRAGTSTMQKSHSFTSSEELDRNLKSSLSSTREFTQNGEKTYTLFNSLAMFPRQFDGVLLRSANGTTTKPTVTLVLLGPVKWKQTISISDAFDLFILNSSCNDGTTGFNEFRQSIATSSSIETNDNMTNLQIHWGQDSNYESKCDVVLMLNATTLRRLTVSSTSSWLGIENLFIVILKPPDLVVGGLAPYVATVIDSVGIMSSAGAVVNPYGAASLQSIALLRSLSCGSDQLKDTASGNKEVNPPNWILCPLCGVGNPFGVTAYGLVVLWNTTLMILVLLAHAMIAFICSKTRAIHDENDVSTVFGKIMFPSLTYMIVTAVLQANTSYGLLAFQGMQSGPLEYFLAAMGTMVLPTILIGIHVWILKKCIRGSTIPTSPETLWENLIYPTCVWLPQDEVSAYGAFYSNYTPKYKSFSVFLLGYYIAFALLCGIHVDPGNTNGCMIQLVVLMLLQSCLGIIYVVFRPMRTTMLNVFRCCVLLAQSATPLLDIVEVSSNVAMVVITITYLFVVMETIVICCAAVFEAKHMKKWGTVTEVMSEVHVEEEMVGYVKCTEAGGDVNGNTVTRGNPLAVLDTPLLLDQSMRWSPPPQLSLKLASMKRNPSAVDETLLL